MPYRRGEAISLKADIQNRLEDFALSQLSGATAGSNRPISGRAIQLRVKNTSGGHMTRFSLCQLSSEVISVDTTEQGKRDPSLVCADPVWPSVCGTFAVLLEPIPDGKFGVVAISGVCIADVDMVLAGDRRAAPDPSDPTRLRSCDTGEVRLLGTTTGTGVKKRIVEIGNSSVVMWGYKRVDAAPDETVTLRRLDDAADFHASGTVELEDERSFMDGQVVNDVGLCFQVDDTFRAIQASC